jgi:hypothetical protein
MDFERRKIATTANSYYNGFGQLAQWKIGFVFE